VVDADPEQRAQGELRRGIPESPLGLPSTALSTEGKNQVEGESWGHVDVWSQKNMKEILKPIPRQKL
jgi:hypothetical protein